MLFGSLPWLANLWLKNIFLSQYCVPKYLVWHGPKGKYLATLGCFESRRFILCPNFHKIVLCPLQIMNNKYLPAENRCIQISKKWPARKVGYSPFDLLHWCQLHASTEVRQFSGLDCCQLRPYNRRVVCVRQDLEHWPWHPSWEDIRCIQCDLQRIEKL